MSPPLQQLLEEADEDTLEALFRDSAGSYTLNFLEHGCFISADERNPVEE